MPRGTPFPRDWKNNPIADRVNAFDTGNQDHLERTPALNARLIIASPMLRAAVETVRAAMVDGYAMRTISEVVRAAPLLMTAACRPAP